MSPFWTWFFAMFGGALLTGLGMLGRAVMTLKSDLRNLPAWLRLLADAMSPPTLPPPPVVPGGVPIYVPPEVTARNRRPRRESRIDTPPVGVPSAFWPGKPGPKPGEGPQ